ncbi:hypothetical protein CEXT_261321 [Caerostris extrusa]|uniref:Maturase K n=1 Tax=Caerostris extrusa TaxID=172846 RepID=A0AAV4U0F8_CAEEX|nr:hypothetical protein CEXT_261321 [Caerostris extrusa]
MLILIYLSTTIEYDSNQLLRRSPSGIKRLLNFFYLSLEKVTLVGIFLPFRAKGLKEMLERSDYLTENSLTEMEAFSHPPLFLLPFVLLSW